MPPSFLPWQLVFNQSEPVGFLDMSWLWLLDLHKQTSCASSIISPSLGKDGNIHTDISDNFKMKMIFKDPVYEANIHYSLNMVIKQMVLTTLWPLVKWFALLFTQVHKLPKKGEMAGLPPAHGAPVCKLGKEAPSSRHFTSICYKTVAIWFCRKKRLLPLSHKLS